MVEGLSAAWGANLEDVVKANNLRRETDVTIGDVNGEAVKVQAIKVMKPTKSSVKRPSGFQLKS